MSLKESLNKGTEMSSKITTNWGLDYKHYFFFLFKTTLPFFGLTTLILKS